MSNKTKIDAKTPETKTTRTRRSTRKRKRVRRLNITARAFNLDTPSYDDDKLVDPPVDSNSELSSCDTDASEDSAGSLKEFIASEDENENDEEEWKHSGVESDDEEEEDEKRQE